MSKALLIKRGSGFLPLDEPANALHDRTQDNGVIEGAFTVKRNPQFHRKFFAMIKVGFDMWEPSGFEYNGKTVNAQKNIEAFREYVIILAGFKEIYGYPDGKVRVKAKSISFSSMDDLEFEKVYNRVLDVILSEVCPKVRKEDYENAVMKIIGFD